MSGARGLLAAGGAGGRVATAVSAVTPAQVAQTTRGTAVATRPPAPPAASKPRAPDIESFEVSHWQALGPDRTLVGVLGERSFGVRSGDAVSVRADFARPVQAALVSLDADGGWRLLWPKRLGPGEKSEVKWEQAQGLRFPGGDVPGQNLSPVTGGGTQAFVVLAAEELPPWPELARNLGAWRRIEPAAGVVGYDAEGPFQMIPPKGAVHQGGDRASLPAQIGEALRGEVPSVVVIAFPVWAKAPRRWFIACAPNLSARCPGPRIRSGAWPAPCRRSSGSPACSGHRARPSAHSGAPRRSRPGTAPRRRD
jgi:hypothetical protein